MKIAHVVDSMEVGGAEILVSQMCRVQRARGHDPCVYAVGNLGDLGRQLLNEGFAVESNIGPHLLNSARSFYHIFKQTRPHIVHLHNPTPAIYAAIPARMAGVPSIVSTRHSLVAPPHRRVAELKYAIAATCCNWIAGICDATVGNLRNLHTIPPRKIVRVYNGAVPLSRAPQEQCPAHKGFTLLYVGRLAPVKDLPLLLNAFCAAHSALPDLRLWMVGDGSERASLEALAAALGIASEVTFWGQQIDVARFYSGADAFIMSSMSEGLPMSLLQAFSLGLPSVVTDVGGMAEAVRLAKAGLIVPASNSAEMAAAILHLAASDVEREQFSMNAEAAFHARFALETMVNAYMDLYRVDSRGRRTLIEPSLRQD